VEFGIDGWRLDVPAEIDDDAFWREFRKRVKGANPDAYITGEIWHDARRWLKGDQFDAVMNYLFTKLCIEFFIGANTDLDLVKGSSMWPVNSRTPESFARGIEELLELYPRPVTEVQLNLLGSHDTARYLTLARGDETALRLSTLMQMVYPGAPCVYYGDEIGMSGGKDPLSRGAFPWDEEKWNADLLAYFKKCISLRHAHPALRTGEYHTLLARDSVYALGRRLEEDLVVAAFNVGRAVTECRIPVEGFLQDGVRLRDIFKRDTYSVQDGAVTVHILPRSGVALEVVGE
jgi:cyclomaltodextrinase